ncbi:MAG: carbohydrate kinase [Flavobacteriaceae bacterium]|nr:carbohydrate kinase [Flavobacteriaceae bacterium]
MILIFDIGKTNKKCYLFDEKFQIIEQEQTVFAEIKDEDGFACDDIEKLTNWILQKFQFYKEKYTITNVNFSTYGASFVHLDKENKVLTPLYNYLKTFDKKLEEKFISNYGSVEKFESETASPYMGFLNSGLQLYWLKNKRPKIAKQIENSLHFPQYCSFLLTKNKFSEYTSIGCHTGLWDFEKREYHYWVKKEDIIKQLATIVTTDHFEEVDDIKVGVGIHDSSAALVPYLIGVKEKFMVISTGTWSIVLNPFSKESLTKNDLKNDCLQFMQMDGKPVKVSRLFLGKEHEIQTKKLAEYFGTGLDYFKSIFFDKSIYNDLKKKDLTSFKFKELTNEKKVDCVFSILDDYKTAYHQLIFELVKKQIVSLDLALGKTKGIKTIFIDGGFSNNELYCKMLANQLPQFQIKIASLASGSALGAAIVINKDNFDRNIFENVLKIKTV